MRSLLLVPFSALALAFAVPAYADTVTGTDVAETLHGTSSADVINALGGDDTVYADGGGDVARGGDGDDFLYGGRGADKLTGGDGSDRLWGGRGSDRLDDAHGSTVDALRAGAGDDVIFANFRDVVFGGDGNDKITVVFPGAMTVNCGKGVDSVTFNEPHPHVLLVGCEHVRIVSAG
jgi:hypothetical protein